MENPTVENEVSYLWQNDEHLKKNYSSETLNSNDSGVKTESSILSIKISNENDENVVIQLFPNKKKSQKNEKGKLISQPKRQKAGGGHAKCRDGDGFCSNVYRNIFGPTIDETLFVGMETLQNFCDSDCEIHNSMKVEVGSDTTNSKSELKDEPFFHTEANTEKEKKMEQKKQNIKHEEESKIKSQSGFDLNRTNSTNEEPTEKRSLKKGENQLDGNLTNNAKTKSNIKHLPKNYAKYSSAQTSKSPAKRIHKTNPFSVHPDFIQNNKNVPRTCCSKCGKAFFINRKYSRKHLEMLRKYYDVKDLIKFGSCPNKCTEKITAYFTIEQNSLLSKDKIREKSEEFMKLYRFSFNTNEKKRNKRSQCKEKCTKSASSSTVSKARRRVSIISIKHNKEIKHNLKVTEEDVSVREPVPSWQKKQSFPTAYFIKSKSALETDSDNRENNNSEPKLPIESEDKLTTPTESVNKSEKNSIVSTSSSSSTSSCSCDTSAKSTERSDCIVCRLINKKCQKFPSALVFPTGQTFMPSFLKKLKKEEQFSMGNLQVYRVDKIERNSFNSSEIVSRSRTSVSSSADVSSSNQFLPTYTSSHLSVTKSPSIANISSEDINSKNINKSEVYSNTPFSKEIVSRQNFKNFCGINLRDKPEQFCLIEKTSEEPSSETSSVENDEPEIETNTNFLSKQYCIQEYENYHEESILTMDEQMSSEEVSNVSIQTSLTQQDIENLLFDKFMTQCDQKLVSNILTQTTLTQQDMESMLFDEFMTKYDRKSVLNNSTQTSLTKQDMENIVFDEFESKIDKKSVFNTTTQTSLTQIDMANILSDEFMMQSKKQSGKTIGIQVSLPQICKKLDAKHLGPDFVSVQNKTLQQIKLHSIEIQTDEEITIKLTKECCCGTDSAMSSSLKFEPDEEPFKEISFPQIETQETTLPQKIKKEKRDSELSQEINNVKRASILSQKSRDEKLEDVKQRNAVPNETRYAITRVTKYDDFTTYEVLKSTKAKPKVMPCFAEGVFIVKNKDNMKSTLHNNTSV